MKPAQKPSPGSRGSRTDRPATSALTTACLAAAILGAGLLAYANSFSGPFIFDDLSSIPDNPNIRRLRPLWQAMSAPPQSTAAGRPVVSLSLALNYAIDGLNVRGYHAFNLAVHLLAALVLFGIIQRTLRSPVLGGRFERAAPWLGAATAMLWMLHPLQTEAVTYVIQRTELLMGLFYLLTLYCAIRGFALPCTAGRRDLRPMEQAAGAAPACRARPLWFAAAVASCALGMGSKEVMASAPLMVLLYDRAFVSGSFRAALRRHAALYGGLAATWLILAALVLQGPRSRTVGFSLGFSAWHYLLTQAGVIVHYLRLSVWPHPLVICYSDWPHAARVVDVLPQALVVLGLLGATVWSLWRYPVLGLPGAWFFLILAPTSSFIPIVTEVAAERRMHLPLAAVVTLTVVGGYQLLAAVCRRAALRPRAPAFVGLGAVTVAAVVFGVLTAARNRDYRSELAIWSDAVAKRPRSAEALCARGCAYNALGNRDRAIADFTRAIELEPDYAEAYNNRGSAYAALGNPEGAIADFTKAIERKPDFADAFYNRGCSYRATGQYDLALADFTRAIELEPGYADAYNNRGNAYATLGNPEGAIADFTKAIERKPDFADAFYNRGCAHKTLGRYDLAIADFTRAIELKPDYVAAYNNRGNTYNLLGEADRAIRDLSRAIELNPTGALAYNNRAVIYAGRGDFDRALADFTKAIELKPDYVDAYNNRGMVYCRLKAYDKARADLQMCRQVGGTPSPNLLRAIAEAAGRQE